MKRSKRSGAAFSNIGKYMKFIDWFAGIGGFRRGMELAGHECVGFCEYDRFATASYTSMHLITEEQRGYLSTLPLRERQKDILKEEYRNGEWYRDDIRGVHGRDVPDADCWCFGFPCQDISSAGKMLGFSGSRSSLFFEVMRLLDERKENGFELPGFLFIENVKNLLSVSRGFDFAAVLSSLDERGYDAEWSVLNSKDFGVPQNRERCFIIGHLRGRDSSEVFPVEGTDGENHVHGIGHRKGYRRNTQIFDRDGITEALDTAAGGGRGHHTIEIIGKMYERGTYGDNRNRILGVNGIAPAQTATQYKEPYRVGICIDDAAGGGREHHTIEVIGSVYCNASRNPNFKRGIYDIRNGVRCLKSKQHDTSVVLDVGDKPVCSIWYPPKQCNIAIRKLTPKECFRLQGWADDYFTKAQFVNSDSQLYKQAGNGVTVPVIQAIAERLQI